MSLMYRKKQPETRVCTLLQGILLMLLAVPPVTNAEQNETAAMPAAEPATAPQGVSDQAVTDSEKEAEVAPVSGQDTATQGASEQAVAESEAGTEPAPVAEQAPEQVLFDIWEYRVEGNDLLPRGLIERTVYPYLGPDKSIDTVEAARQGLEQVYKNQGYGTVFVDIPEQDVAGGIVTLQITEGELERVRITGSRYYSLGRIREQLPALQEGTTPHLPEVQKQLAALNRGASDRSVTPVMKPGREPGKLEVELKVIDKRPLHGSIELNNQYTRDTSKTRLNASLRYDNLWQKEHSASLGYVVAPENRDEVEVVYGTYMFRYGERGNSIAMYAVDSASDVVTAGDISQIGAGNIYGLRASFPLPILNDYFHSLTLGADYKDFEETTQLLGFDAQNTPISYTSFSALYSGIWFTDSSQTTFTTEAHLGVRGLGNTAKEFERKRAFAKPNFSYLKMSLERKSEWFLDSSLILKLTGQVADSALISNEQFAAGGVDTVRGYLESQQLADDGITGRIQINSPSIAEQVWSELSDLHFLAFVDAARLRLIDPLPGQARHFSLASTGLGLELAALDGLSANATWAWALRENGTIERGDSRIHLSIGYEF